MPHRPRPTPPPGNAPGSPPGSAFGRIRRRLLAWYDQHHRRLPWRASPKSEIRNSKSEIPPYHVLVSEAMLQQTQVATVIPYFLRFIEAFPTAASLAAADEQDVLRLWQGLGYYRRARNLHAAARMIVERFAGEVPGSVEELLELPGVGRYTAGAVASIAHGQRAPILDGNVARVLARLFEIEEPTDRPAVRTRLWDLAEQLVPASRPGDFNQAMMELGALVCTPKQAKCLYCPLTELCGAHQAGRVDELPTSSPRRAPKAVTHTVAAIERRGQYLFEQRPSIGLWSNMWQLPTAESLDDSSLPAWIRTRFGLTAEPAGDVHTFTHQTTHRTIRFEVVPLRVTAGRLRPGIAQWRRLDQLADLPLSNPQRRIVAALRSRCESIRKENHEGTKQET